MKYTTITILAFASTVWLESCQSDKQKELKKTCIDINVFKAGKLVTVDSCFTASTTDSLDLIISDFRKRQAELVEKFDTRLMFVIIDTIGKKPDEYEYALVLSEAGVINPEVILSRDGDYIKEKLSAYNPKNLIFKKVGNGENINSLVEVIFKTNIRINYRRVENTKINS